MAKRRKRKKPSLRSHKKAIQDRKDRTAFWRSVGAIFLIITGIVLAFGAVISAPIPHSFWNGAWWALGIATFIAPLALLYLGSLKFISEDRQIPLPKMAGVLGLLDHDAQFAQDVNRLLVRHTAVLRAKIDIVAAGSVPKRLAALLLYLLERFGSVRADGIGRIPIVLTRLQISELVDARIETVIRILSRWQKADWLRTAAGGFELCRVDMLRRIAGG